MCWSREPWGKESLPKPEKYPDSEQNNRIKLVISLRLRVELQLWVWWRRIIFLVFFFQVWIIRLNHTKKLYVVSILSYTISIKYDRAYNMHEYFPSSHSSIFGDVGSKLCSTYNTKRMNRVARGSYVSFCKIGDKYILREIRVRFW